MTGKVNERLTAHSDTVRSASFGLEIDMSNRRLAVVSGFVALLLGAIGVFAIYGALNKDLNSPVPKILQACLAGDSASCYSFAGLQMSGQRDMALAALEMCASDPESPSRFDCMYKLANAHQTGREGQRNFVLAHRWYSTLIHRGGPTALVDVARNRLRAVELIMSRDQIAMARAQSRSWLGIPKEPPLDPIPAGLGTRL